MVVHKEVKGQLEIKERLEIKGRKATVGFKAQIPDCKDRVELMVFKGLWGRSRAQISQIGSSVIFMAFRQMLTWSPAHKEYKVLERFRSLGIACMRTKS
jgi:hypothetical protein